MIDVQQIVQLHDRTTVLWHRHPIDNNYHGVMQLICQQHMFNYKLWHKEDIARSPSADDARIAKVKRAIDKLNQARNDHIEKLDDWLTKALHNRQITPNPDAKQCTETPGSAIDRLSIMALRLYHYNEQLLRPNVDEDHITMVQSRIALCLEQRHDLSYALTTLLSDIVASVCIHKTYRQMKMYNDPSLNPYLYNSNKPRNV